MAVELFFEGVLGKELSDEFEQLVELLGFLYICWMSYLHITLKWMFASDRTRIFTKSLLLAGVVGVVSYFFAGSSTAIIAALITIIGGMLFLRAQ